jgi:hypothetical protein
MEGRGGEGKEGERGRKKGKGGEEAAELAPPKHKNLIPPMHAGETHEW